MKRLLIIIVGIIFAFSLIACGKKEEKLNYGSTPGKAEGIVDFSDGSTKIDIKDVEVDQGDFVDYTSGITFKGTEEDEYVSITADASEVDNFTPGTYEVEYTISYGDKTYKETSKVTVKENSSYTAPTKNNSNNSGNSTSGGSSSAGNSSNANETTAAAKKDIGKANITLLNGDVVTIDQTTERFITRTYTEENTIQRNGVEYKVSKLIVEFNTGENRIIETTEQPIIY